MSETPFKEQCLVVELEWRTGTFAAPTTNTVRFTDLDTDIVLDASGNTLTSDTSLKVEFPERTAGVEEESCRLTLGLRDTSLLNIAKGYAFQKVSCRIRRFEFNSETGTSSIAASSYRMFEGRVSSARINPQGQDNLIELFVDNCKKDLEVASGRRLVPQCDLAFGGPVCGVDLTPLVVSATINAVNGTTISITETVAGDITSNPQHYWKEGTVWVNGLEIKVRNWDGSLDMDLAQLPPEDWAALVPFSAEFIPGCRKVPFDCRQFNNEERFSGLGIAIPDRHPIFERGTPA